MGKTLVVYKIYPEEPGQEVGIQEALKEAVKEGEVKDIKVEPIAFGLKVVRVAIVFDEGQSPDKAEEQLKSIPNVKDVEAEQTTLL